MKIQPRRSKKAVLNNSNSLEERSSSISDASWFSVYPVVFWQEGKLISTKMFPLVSQRVYRVLSVCQDYMITCNDTMGGNEQIEMYWI